MDRERLARLLLALARGGTIEEAAEAAGLEPGEVEALIAALVSEGYLERVAGAPKCPCSRCPFRHICGGRRAPGAFILTDKGIRLLESMLRARGDDAQRYANR